MIMDKYGDSSVAVMTARQVRDFDAWAINELGIPGVVLMENAGRGCARLILEKLNPAKVLVICGKGNNGGDGFVIARHLYNAGAAVKVALLGQADQVKGDAAVNLKIWQKLGHLVELDPESHRCPQELEKLTRGCDVVVDAIFGTGLQSSLKEPWRPIIRAVNSNTAKVVAIDIPSGLDCDTGMPLEACGRADYTVTMVAAKKGFARKGAREYTGNVYVVDIGIVPQDLRS